MQRDLLLEKLRPAQDTDTARALAGNCRRVLARLDPASFVDALAELARGNHGIARSEATELLGHADTPEAVTVLAGLLDDGPTWQHNSILISLHPV